VSRISEPERRDATSAPAHASDADVEPLLATRRTALSLTAAATAAFLADRALSPQPAQASEAGELANRALSPQLTQAIEGGGEPINVKSYGAKGDGVTDDTAAFQRAGEEAMAHNAKLIVPGSAKAYRVDSVQWDFPSETRPMYIEGAGKFKTMIEKIGSDSSPIFKLAGSSGALSNNSLISGMSLRGLSQGSPGLELENCAWIEVDDIDVRGCSVGIAGIGLLTSVMKRMILDGNTEGLSLTKGEVGCNLLTVEHSIISGNSYRGINADHCPSLRLEHVDIENNGETGKVNTGGLYIGENVTQEYGYGIISVSGCWFEVNKGRALTCASGELRIRESIFLATDLSTAATRGRDIFVTGKTYRCSIVDSQAVSVAKMMPSIWVDHQCIGRIQNSIIDYTLLPSGMQIQEH
jgi:hypothetical protein